MRRPYLIPTDFNEEKGGVGRKCGVLLLQAGAWVYATISFLFLRASSSAYFTPASSRMGRSSPFGSLAMSTTMESLTTWTWTGNGAPHCSVWLSVRGLLAASILVQWCCFCALLLPVTLKILKLSQTSSTIRAGLWDRSLGLFLAGWTGIPPPPKCSSCWLATIWSNITSAPNV